MCPDWSHQLLFEALEFWNLIYFFFPWKISNKAYSFDFPATERTKSYFPVSAKGVRGAPSHAPGPLVCWTCWGGWITARLWPQRSCTHGAVWEVSCQADATSQSLPICSHKTATGKALHITSKSCKQGRKRHKPLLPPLPRLCSISWPTAGTWGCGTCALGQDLLTLAGQAEGSLGRGSRPALALQPRVPGTSLRVVFPTAGAQSAPGRRNFCPCQWQSSVLSGVGLPDPCGSLPTQHILGFCGSCRVGREHWVSASTSPGTGETGAAHSDRGCWCF